MFNNLDGPWRPPQNSFGVSEKGSPKPAIGVVYARNHRQCRCVELGIICKPWIIICQYRLEEAIMPYVDGFVLAVPKNKIDAYKELARKAGDVWKEYGALSYVECIGDDVPYGELTSFPRAVQAKDDEIVIFSWITYESREQRDAINAKVMEDPRLKGGVSDMPFDGKRMIYGGFNAFLEL
jgi:uncharacterized protein YbaA (DUF1428 family)